MTQKFRVISSLRKQIGFALTVGAGCLLTAVSAWADQPPAPDAGAGKADTRPACCRVKAEESAPATVTELEAVDIPDLELVRSDGARVRLRNELEGGQTVMLNFIFTTCTTICPVMAATFAQVQDGLGADGDNVRLVSVSIDPSYDTPARLAEFARAHDAGPEWHFLTGKPADIEAVQKAFGAYRGSKFNHAAVTFVRGAGTQRWQRIGGLTSAGVLEAALRCAAVE
jgi:protein SCO1